MPSLQGHSDTALGSPGSQRVGSMSRRLEGRADDLVARATVPAAAAATTAVGAAAAAVGLAYTQRARSEVSPVQFGDGVVRGVVVHFDKAKASGTSRFTVGDDPCRNHLTVGGKKFRQFLVSRRPREVSNVDLLHWVSMIRFAAHCLAVQLGLRPPSVKTPAVRPDCEVLTKGYDARTLHDRCSLIHGIRTCVLWWSGSRGLWMSRSISRVLSWAIIHLRRPSPVA